MTETESDSVTWMKGETNDINRYFGYESRLILILKVKEKTWIIQIDSDIRQGNELSPVESWNEGMRKELEKRIKRGWINESFGGQPAWVPCSHNGKQTQHTVIYSTATTGGLFRDKLEEGGGEQFTCMDFIVLAIIKLICCKNNTKQKTTFSFI